MDGKRVVVGTGSHPVELTRIQPAGKKMMAAADWARGQATLESVVFE
jgi:methionyl-tRNA formyltransferase